MQPILLTAGMPIVHLGLLLLMYWADMGVGALGSGRDAGSMQHGRLQEVARGHEGQCDPAQRVRRVPQLLGLAQRRKNPSHASCAPAQLIWANDAGCTHIWVFS